MESVKTLQNHQVWYNNSANVCIPLTVLQVILHRSIPMRKMLFQFNEKYFYKQLLVIKNPTFLQQISINCMLYTRSNARNWKCKDEQELTAYQGRQIDNQLQYNIYINRIAAIGTEVYASPENSVINPVQPQGSGKREVRKIEG